jgi:hypothetical protein
MKCIMCCRLCGAYPGPALKIRGKSGVLLSEGGGERIHVREEETWTWEGEGSVCAKRELYTLNGMYVQK